MDEPLEREPSQRPRRVRYIVLGFVLGVIAVAALIFVLFGGTSGVGLDYISMLLKMDTIDHLIDKYYLYEADPDEIGENIFLGMLYGLGEDDYAQYYPPAIFEEVDREQNGSYVGIGISVVKDEETGGIRIESVSSPGPAQAAGLRIGDIIISADGADLTSLTLSDAVALITGEEGSSVELGFLRDGESMDAVVTRETIVTTYSVHSHVFGASDIEGARMGSVKVGYISVSQFIRTTYDDFSQAYETLVLDEEADGLIIDLRNNTGGDLSVCLDMLRLIVSADDEVVYESDTPYEEGDLEDIEGALLLASEDKYGSRDLYYSDSVSIAKLPIVVLVNAMSASASEIMAGVLRDYGYTLLGTRTFGKGIMQSVISLNDGSAVKFTTNQYRLPSGDYIHGIGIEPEVELAFEPYGDVTETSVNFASGDEEPDMAGDNQIQAALGIIEGEAYRRYQETA